MIVYCITNKINDKKYVGITTQKDYKARFRRHCNDSKFSKLPLHAAINKYGKENFTFEIIDQAQDVKELKEKEIRWIAKLNTMNEGYNLSAGGDGCNGYNHTEDHKQYMSQIMKGKNRGGNRRGIPCSKETAEKISNKHKEGHLAGRYKTRKGQTNSAEHNKKTSITRTGMIVEKARKTYKITHPDGKIEIVKGLIDFCKKQGLHAGNISSVAHGRLKQYKGFKAELIEDSI